MMHATPWRKVARHQKSFRKDKFGNKQYQKRTNSQIGKRTNFQIKFSKINQSNFGLKTQQVLLKFCQKQSLKDIIFFTI